jgi:carbon storage regulator
MLVLSRKKDESIVINNDITIVVVEIRGDKVRLGVEAPKEVPVHRREVFDAIARGEDLSISASAPRPEEPGEPREPRVILEVGLVPRPFEGHPPDAAVTGQLTDGAESRTIECGVEGEVAKPLP